MASGSKETPDGEDIGFSVNVPRCVSWVLSSPLETPPSCSWAALSGVGSIAVTDAFGSNTSVHVVVSVDEIPGMVKVSTVVIMAPTVSDAGACVCVCVARVPVE